MLNRAARLLSLLLLLLTLPPQLLAQEMTSTPQIIPLNVGDPVTGRLERQGDEITYRFYVPQGYDLMAVVEADAAVLPHYCIETYGDGDVRRECPGWGGSGEDGPVTRELYIPGDTNPNTEHKIDFIINRPLSGEANFTLKVNALAHQTLTLGRDKAQEPNATQPYQVYTLRADPSVPFSVQVADTAEDGNFLWAAHEPFQIDFSAQESPLLVPRFLDGAANEAAHGVQSLSLHYLGGQEFRVLVKADADYSLHSTPLAYQALDAGMPLTVTLSYRDPVRVLRLSNDAAGALSVNVSVADGVGALVRAYTSNDPYGQGIALGKTDTTEFTLSATLDLAPSSTPVVLVLQVPFEFTRDSVIMQVLWRRDT